MIGRVNSVELVDAGVHRRLERFGPFTVDRPAPAASGFRHAPGATWDAADLRFDAGRGWSGPAWPAEPWTVDVEGLAMELRPTSSGGLGLYPEHAVNLEWLEGAIRGRGGSDAIAGTTAAPQVLNLFAHTGLATLALARAGAAVTHVDAARSAVAWARRNAELSGLDDRPIRWIVDDAATFAAREARRGRRYDGIVLDPPAYGRAGARRWRLVDELPALLTMCRRIANDDSFVVLTTHSEGIDGDDIRLALDEAFGGGGATEIERLAMKASSGARLEAGWAVRRMPGRPPGQGRRR